MREQLALDCLLNTKRDQVNFIFSRRDGAWIKNETIDLVDIGLFSAQAVIFDPNKVCEPGRENAIRQPPCLRNEMKRSPCRLLAKQWVDRGETELYGGDSVLYVRQTIEF